MTFKKLKIVIPISIAIFLLVFAIDACKKSDDVFGSTPLAFNIPQGWPQPLEIFANNPPTEEKFQLGRKLFYEGKLSKDGRFPCSSCHEQVASFTTLSHDRSHGYNNSHTLRNAPALFNIAWRNELNWDGSADHLNIALLHITSPVEMGENVDAVLQKLRADSVYVRMFKEAYNDNEITSQNLLKALELFVAFIISDNSKYDKVKRGEATFNINEQNGYIIFKAKCNSCHTEPLFTDNSYRNVGLPVDPTLKDYGRMRGSGNKNDSLKFRVPTLRNLNLTSYYAHDGRFSDVALMLQHYVLGVQQSATLDPLLRNGIPLSNIEISYLISFLSTLTDASITTNPRFSQP